MQWYELDWKLKDGTTISHSSDGYTRDTNLRDIFTAIKVKVDELDSHTMMHMTNISVLQSQVAVLQNENEFLKRMMVKIIQKDYPEIVIEQPEFVSANLEKQLQNSTYTKLV